MSNSLFSHLPDLKQATDIRSYDARTTTAAVATVMALSGAWIVKDYYDWVAFGTGGTPPTPAGYWRMTKLRWRMFWLNPNLKDASPLPTDGPSFLPASLPKRQGDPPQIIARTLPQRQVPKGYHIPKDVDERLHALCKKYVDAHPDILILDLSKTEGRSTYAIYAKPDLPGRTPGAKDPILGDECAHVHPAENSLHVWVSGPDARKIVEAGWGLRFPLSAMGLVHPTWILLYAPRNMAEVDIAEQCIKAAIGFLTGEKV